MIRFLTLVILYSLFTNPVEAQNLVKNSSFEYFDYTSRFLNTTGLDFEKQVKHWTVPNQASTDLISPRMKNKNITTIPAHTGKNMAGIVINGDFWAEYLAIKLKKPIKAGVNYYVEFWIAMPPVYSKKKMKATKLNANFGVRFGDKVFNLDKKILPGKPQIHATTETLIEPKKWTKIFGTYSATEAADYLYIGQFLNPDIDPNIVIGYFFIDDVFVEPFSSTAIDFVPSSYYRIKGSTASVIMENIYFETDKHDLLLDSEKELDKLVNIMNKNPSIAIEILGHTDDQGDIDHNASLSENRAKTVYDYLVAEGIPQKRLRSQGMGYTKPVASNSTDAGRQKNRRVEFKVSGEITADNLPQGPGDVYRFSKNADSAKPLQLSFTNPNAFKNNCMGESGAPDLDPDQKSLLAKCNPVNAKKHILEKTKDQQTVFFNEYALNPQNRIFFISLLQELKDQGFNYLALDALSGKDNQLQERGYPVLNSGYLTREPVFGELIRTAIDMGFDLLSFNPSKVEVKKAQQILGKKFGAEDEGMARRWAQGMNIYRIRKKYPDAKILIYSSEPILNESGDETERSAAAWYKALSSKDPFTIEQSSMTDKCELAKHPLFASRAIKEPTIFMAKVVSKKVSFKTGSTDLQVFHPAYSTIYNRPNWMTQTRTPYLFNPDKHGMAYPCMVLAYKPDEDPDFAVPIDVVEFKDNGEKTALMLPKGDWVLVMTDYTKHKKLEVVVK